ncbi:MAG: uroporphyrinogen decarboxylase [Clostridiales bacterium]|nr:uroporphyrinogen decarboxylase [Clostridiales bacterium]
MTPKEILLAAMRHEETPITPWVPFAGVHAGSLLGYDAKSVLTDADKLYESLLEVNKLYLPCGLPIMFDLQMEAEILGCDLVWSETGPPFVSSHPLEESGSVPCLCNLPQKEDGRLPVALDVMHRLKKSIGNDVALYGLICGPFTLASHLRGTNIFMDMYDDEDYVKDLVEYCAAVCKRISDFYIEAGMDVIALVDPMVSQISSDHFQEFFSSAFSDIFKHIRAQGVFSSFFVCGDATRNIEAMCQTRPDSVAIDENIELLEAKKITDKYNITLCGNIPLTTVMLHGSQQDNIKCAIDLMDAVGQKRNFILAPGCDMPYALPAANSIAIAQTVWQTDSMRQLLENYVADQDEFEVILPDYENLNKPLIEVFTLDSTACAACTYMMASARDMEELFGDKIEIVEYSSTLKENIVRARQMGVDHLPSIYINGQLKFSSLIPDKNKFAQHVKEAIKEIEAK